MDDRYWPARVGYLRRGTPVRMVAGAEWAEDTVVTGIGVDEVGQYVYCMGIAGAIGYDRLYLDLSDVTARAHAAWAYTWVAFRGRPAVKKQWDKLGDYADAQQVMLCRMAAGDETVTVSEARAALAWAESVGGGK